MQPHLTRAPPVTGGALVPAAPIFQSRASLVKSGILRSRLALRSKIDELSRAVAREAGHRARTLGRTVVIVTLIAGIGLFALSALSVRMFSRLRRR